MAGVSTAAENQLVEQWMNEDPSHGRYYNQMLKEFMQPSATPMTDEEIGRFIRQFDAFVLAENNRRERIVQRRTTLLRAAAVWAGILLTGATATYLYKMTTSGETAPGIQLADTVKPGESKASIILSDGDTITLDGAGDMLYMDGASGVTITKRGGLISYKHDPAGRETQQEIHNTIAVPVGGEYILELADGSKIWLNAKTTLHFPARFAGKRRTVELDGEAYFEIAHKARTPFVVRTSTSDIKVYGTKFNVLAYNGEAMHTTTLCEGSVSVKAAGGKEIFLKPGEQLQLVNGTEASVKEVNSNAYASWHAGSFVFENESLYQIMNQLSKWYDVEVVFADESLKTLHFTGDLQRNGNLSDILNMIRITHNEIVFEMQNNILVVRSKKPINPNHETNFLH